MPSPETSEPPLGYRRTESRDGFAEDGWVQIAQYGAATPQTSHPQRQAFIDQAKVAHAKAVAARKDQEQASQETSLVGIDVNEQKKDFSISSDLMSLLWKVSRSLQAGVGDQSLPEEFTDNAMLLHNILIEISHE